MVQWSFVWESKAGFSIKHLMKTQMWFLSIAMRRCTGRQLAEQLPIWTPLDWYLYVANHKPSPKSPQIGGINHQNMSGVSLFYQHYTIEVHTSSLFAILTSWKNNIAIENCHLVRWFTHWTWWFSIVFRMFRGSTDIFARWSGDAAASHGAVSHPRRPWPFLCSAFSPSPGWPSRFFYDTGETTRDFMGLL